MSESKDGLSRRGLARGLRILLDVFIFLIVAASGALNVASIGVGGQGRTNCRALFQEDDCQIIALADPCERQREPQRD